MIHYLSTHDLVWINAVVVGQTLEFDYEALEECMAAQYSYGDSTLIVEQAAFLLDKFLTRRPFQYGNLRTAFVAVLAFLTANKHAVKGDDARIADLIGAVAGGQTTAMQAVKEVSEPTELGLRPGATLRTLVTYLCNERKEALRLLADGDGPPG